ncbi:DinB family protein [Streptomyces sp. NBC_00597]|uniref:mycothiol transferase n=1 Tax=Streptomyces sp. NBC_00597 TaxID=2975786 RepID=UPI0030E2E3BC
MFVHPDQDTRTDGGFKGERAVLAGYLRDQRLTLELKCAGLDAEVMARRSVEPSNPSLLGLVRNLAGVEQYWFRQVMAGEDVRLRGLPDGLWHSGTGRAVKGGAQRHREATRTKRAPLTGRHGTEGQWTDGTPPHTLPTPLDSDPAPVSRLMSSTPLDSDPAPVSRLTPPTPLGSAPRRSRPASWAERWNVPPPAFRLWFPGRVGGR